MKVLQIGVSVAVLVFLVSCGTLGEDGQRIDYRSGAKQAPSLDVPPDLTVPVSDENYKIPDSGSSVPGTEGVATFSDFSKAGSAQGRITNIVLPEVPGVRVERNGTQRWLAVSENADKVWSVVKAFWAEIGLAINNEDQAAGVMETDWGENRAKFPQGGPHKGLRQEFNYAYAASERDQYITRLERSKDGASTEVHITHRGIKKGAAATNGASQWVARANDSELEAIMLQLLKARFGASEAQAASAVEAVSAVAAAGAAAISTSEPAGTASLREISDGSVVIVMNDPFDRSWRKVGLSIESSGLVVEDKDRDKGIYYLRPVKIERGWWERMKFWKSREEDKKQYRVNVKDGVTACEVSVTDQNGANSKVTREMIETIYKNINQ